ncbi:MAG: hypothetical protein ACUZ9M_06070 [Candidatus Scalindua sp.]
MLHSSSIVFLGNFNPAIFQTQWFDRFKILPIQEIQWAEGEKPKKIELPGTKIIVEEAPYIIITSDHTLLQFPSLQIEVFPDKYICSSKNKEAFSLIKNVTISIFKVLEHTPIKAVGINFEGDCKFRKGAQEILNDLFVNNNRAFKKTFGNDFRIGGTIGFKQESRKITLRIKGSNTINDGINFSLNFHDDIEPQQAKLAIEVVRRNYDKDIKKSNKIIKDLIGQPKKS